MGSELLQQVRLLDPKSETDRVVDVLLVDGVIHTIADRIDEFPTQSRLRPCQGLVLGPGLVDLYSHSGEPGFEARETLQSLRQAAKAGGFTRLTILPDTSPAIDQPGTLTHLQSQTQPDQDIQVHYWGALTLGAKGEQMAELAELAAAGVIGFTDGKPLPNWSLLRRLLEYTQALQKPIAFWPCNLALAGDGVMRESSAALRLGLPGNPAMTETAAIATLLELVEALGTPVHLMRISTARSVELIQTAKARGLPLTASTTWMHLLLNTESIQTYNPSLRLEPPLGTRTDQLALLEGVRLGTLDVIAIDHTPYTYEEKTVSFAEAPPGAIGLELALPLLWQTLVETGTWTALELWRALSTRAALCLGQKVTAIAPGEAAELTLFDPQVSWEVNTANLLSCSANTPWLGTSLQGRVVQTWSGQR